MFSETTGGYSPKKPDVKDLDMILKITGGFPQKTNMEHLAMIPETTGFFGKNLM